MAKKQNINFIIFIVLFVLWLFPIMQSNLKLVTVESLGGVTNNTKEDTVLNTETWFSGRYAEKKEDYLTDNFGLREIAIRLQNQIQYTFFGKTNADDVILGKSNYLFELKYIRSYYGVDYVGTKYLEEKIQKMKFVQDTLAKLNKTLVFIIAPSKASFFPEYLPEKYKTDSVKTNYKDVKPLIKKYKINCLDYDFMFRNLKETSKYDLYPVAGTHWSEYGTKVALDSLTRYIEQHTKFVCPKLDYSEVNLSDGYEGTDNDMGKAINLLFPPNYGKLAYPTVKYIEPKNMNKPNLLMVSDSYWMSIYYSNIPGRLFNNHSFWYYYNVSNDYHHETEGNSPTDLNLKDELMKKDIICIMCTGPNLKSIGYRFVEDCYDLFKNGTIDQVQRKRLFNIDQRRMYLWNDRESCDKFIKSAIKENRPLDSVITNVAKYLIDSGY